MATIIRGPVTTLVENYLSVNTSEVIPADQHRWYRNVPGTDTTKITLLIGDGVKTIASLPRYLSSSELQLIPGDPSLVKDWVEKFIEETTPPASVVNSWGRGIYYIGISYLFNGTPGRATMTLFVNPGDGFNRYALASMDFTGADSFIGCMYDQADNSFKPMGAGTDYTDLAVYAVYRWENMSTAELSPPVDGWETVFKDYTNTANIPNSWGDGEYLFVLRINNNENVYTSRMKLVSTELAATLQLVQGSQSGGANQARAMWDKDTNLFSAFSDTGTFYIAEISKFNGMLNVLHTVQEVTIDAGIPAGGETGESLRKTSAVSYETDWIEDRLIANRTVNIPAGSTSAEIQALFDAQPRNLNNCVLTFQFADGVYNIASDLTLNNFFGGFVYLQGNSADNTLSPTKSVILNLSANIDINVSRNANLQIRRIRINGTSHTSGNYLIRFSANTHASIVACALYGSVAGYGILISEQGASNNFSNYFNTFSRSLTLSGATARFWGNEHYSCTEIYSDGGYLILSDTVLPTNYNQSGYGVISIAAGIFNVDFPFASPPVNSEYSATGSNGETQYIEKFPSGKMVITCDFNSFATSRIFTFVESFVGTPIPLAVTTRHSAGLGAMQVVGDGYPTSSQIQIVTGTGTAHDYTWQVQGRWK